MTTDPMPPVRAVLADDERLMRDQLRARLAEVWPQLQIVAEARNGQEAVDLVLQHRPEVVFLDIRMPGLSGVDAAREIAQMPLGADEWLPEIVFITAYDQYAVQAFEQGVADYVLKPAERERLARTAQRLQRRLAARQNGDDSAADPGRTAGDDADDKGAAAAAATHPAATDPAPLPLQQLLHRLSAQLNPQPAAPRYLQWIQASVGSTIQMVPVAEVLFFISDEKYTRVQTPTVEALIRKPIKELVDEIDPQQFWQIHRSTLVNVQAIASIERDLRGRQIVSVKGHPQKLEVSRSYGHLFKGM